jgi:uncharacterized protein YkwD
MRGGGVWGGLVALALAGGAGFSGAAALEDWQLNALTKHNEYRALHCAPDLEWDPSLADFAQAYAEALCPKSLLSHSTANPYGENLFASTVSWALTADDKASMTIEGVKGWYEEVADYSYADPGFHQSTGHFTQVVWKESEALGCGAALCTVDGWNKLILSCNYSPAGNVLTSFNVNVLDTTCAPEELPGGPPQEVQCAQSWGQCGGEGWEGVTCCREGAECTAVSPEFWQCRPVPQVDAPAEAPAAVSEAPVDKPTEPDVAVGACAGTWERCGGKFWEGPKCCPADHTCTEVDEWYFHCAPNESLEPAAPMQCAGTWERCGGKFWEGPTCCPQNHSCTEIDEWYFHCAPDENAPLAEPTAPATEAPSTEAPALTLEPVVTPEPTKRGGEKDKGGGSWGKIPIIKLPKPDSPQECAEAYTQCGGRAWTGPTCCPAEHVCAPKDRLFSVCRPDLRGNPLPKPRSGTQPSIDGSVVTPTAAPTEQATEEASCSSVWEQCGGNDWKGPTCCDEGYDCIESHEWYSQCRPAPEKADPACAGTWEQCGGKLWEGSACCPVGHNCTELDEWYSQCVPETQEAPPAAAPVDCASTWEQCGGKSWEGPACCPADHTCTEVDEWYSQCAPSASAQPAGDAPASECSKTWEQCGGKFWEGPKCCPADHTCSEIDEWYFHCAPVDSVAGDAAPVAEPCGALWDQCGGNEWEGLTCCDAGLKCNKLSKWYSQCHPDHSGGGRHLEGGSFTYLGCFEDDLEQRDLGGGMDIFPNLHPAECHSYCRGLGFRVFALQGGRECHCGSTYGRYRRLDRGECSIPCSGDASRQCGGTLANAVFAAPP